MSSPESTLEGIGCSEAKPLIGSSKRKRKSSIIKRNILSDEKTPSDLSDGVGLRNETDSEKRAKTDKSTPKKKGSSPKSEEKQAKRLQQRSVGVNCGESQGDSEDVEERPGDEGTPCEGEDRTKGKEKNTQTTEEEGAHKFCENCNLCAEHKKLQELKTKQTVEKLKKKFACELCEQERVRKLFNTAAKLKAHVRMMHEPQELQEEVKRFLCPACPEPTWFATKSKFCYHLGAKHPGVILFVCDVCTETFKLKANYKNHMASHNIVVQKKFSCDVCGGTFVNKAGFEAHKKRFPGPHIQQTCEHCGFAFSREQHLKNHRCKKLLLEEAARVKASAAALQDVAAETVVEVVVTPDRPTTSCEVAAQAAQAAQATKATNTDDGKKTVLFHRVVPRKPARAIYRPIQIQTDDVEEPMIVHEFREIDFDKEGVTSDTEQQIIVQDVNGQFLNTSQILQFDINEVNHDETQQVFQIML